MDRNDSLLIVTNRSACPVDEIKVTMLLKRQGAW